MRRLTVLPLLLLAAPALLAAQSPGTYHEGGGQGQPNEMMGDLRRLDVLPSLSVGFKVVGDADQGRILRVSGGHLVSGRLYHAIAFITPRDGSAPLRAEGTISAEAPGLAVGALPAGEYTITIHLEDVATGVTRDARNKVVLR